MSPRRSPLLLLVLSLLCSSLLLSAAVKPPAAKLRGVKIHRVAATVAAAASNAAASGIAATTAAASVPAASPAIAPVAAAAAAAAAAPVRARPSASLSLPGVASSEVALRLLLNKESHMAELGPAFLFALLRFLGYLGFGALFAVWWMQGSLLYMPSFGRSNEPRTVQSNPRSFRSPAEYGLRFEEVWLRARDGVLLHSWLVLQPEGVSASAPTLVFFHGNAGNIGYRLPNFKALYNHTRCNILAVEYRGYGNSEGEPSQAGLIMDAEAAIEYLRHGRAAAVGAVGGAGSGGEAKSDIDVSRIHLFGRSLGGAVALHLAAADADAQRAARRDASARGSLSSVAPPLAGVIVENTFLTLTEMVLVLAARIGLVRAMHPPPAAAATASASHSHGHAHGKGAALWRYALRLLMTNHWDNASAVSRIDAPLLFVSGLADELIPAQQMASLYARAGGTQSRMLHTVDSGTHNDTHIRGGAGYFAQLHQFFADTHAARQDRDRNSGIHIAAPAPAAIPRA